MISNNMLTEEEIKHLKVNDRLVLHSKNGIDYQIQIVNINWSRPPEWVFAMNMSDGGEKTYYDVYHDFYFNGIDFMKLLSKK